MAWWYVLQSVCSSLRSLFARRVKDSRPLEQRDPGWKLFGKVPPREGPAKDPKRIQKVEPYFLRSQHCLVIKEDPPTSYTTFTYTQDAGYCFYIRQIISSQLFFSLDAYSLWSWKLFCVWKGLIFCSNQLAETFVHHDMIFMLCRGQDEVWTSEYLVFCGRWRVTLLSWNFSKVYSTTDVPEQRRVVTLLSDLCFSNGGTSWPPDVVEWSAHAGVWSDQCLVVDGCSSVDGLEGQNHLLEPVLLSWYDSNYKNFLGKTEVV